jgi:DNA-directed RNA polymerase specialized sigma24 family protein
MTVREGERAAQPEHAPAVTARVLAEAFGAFSGFLERKVGSRAVSAEILQVAFVHGTQRNGAEHASESAVQWFYRLLRNAVIDQPRHASSSDQKLTAFRVEVEQKLEPDVALQQAIQQCIAALAGTLPAEQAAALRHIELGGLALSAFADQAGISPSAAQLALADGRAALRRQVVNACGLCAVHGSWNCTCGSRYSGYGNT